MKGEAKSEREKRGWEKGIMREQFTTQNQLAIQVRGYTRPAKCQGWLDLTRMR